MLGLPARLLDGYYVYNALLVAALAPLHYHFVWHTPDGSAFSRLSSTVELLKWERQAAGVLVIVAGWYWLRRRSWDHWAQVALFYGRAVAAATAFAVDWRLGAALLLAGLAGWVAFPQPFVEMFGEDRGASTVLLLSPQTMKERVLSSQGGDAKAAWMVYAFVHPQHAPSLAMAPAFDGLARAYAGERLRCAAINVSQWPVFARDTLKLSTSTWGNGLPAVLLYQKGREVARIPAAAAVDETGVRKNTYTARDVVKALGLERFRAAAAADAPPSPSPSSS